MTEPTNGPASGGAAESEARYRLALRAGRMGSLETDLAVTEELAPLVPPDRFLIAESGIRTNADVRRLAAVGPHCFLVGESLMRQPDVTSATRTLLTGDA